MILKLACLFHSLIQLVSTLCMLLVDALHILRLALRWRAVLAAEHLFLRKQLALYKERYVTPQRATSGCDPRVAGGTGAV
jgi:hypothetical protein